jgi:hypothetical protein
MDLLLSGGLSQMMVTLNHLQMKMQEGLVFLRGKREGRNMVLDEVWLR